MARVKMNSMKQPPSQKGIECEYEWVNQQKNNDQLFVPLRGLAQKIGAKSCD